METTNPNRPVDPSETPVQSQSIFNPANIQRGFFAIILGVSVLLVVVGVGAYYLRTKKNSSTNQAVNTNKEIQTQPSPTQATIYTSPSAAINQENSEGIVENDKTKSHVNTAGGYIVQYPQEWNISESKGSDDTSVDYSIELKNSDKVVGYLIIHKKGYLYKPDSNQPRDIILQEWMTWNRFIRTDLPDQKCVETSYGILSGFECILNPYGVSSYNFVTKTNERFIELLTGQKEYFDKFGQLLATFKFLN